MSHQNDPQSAPWTLWKLGILLYVFVVGAAAINVFMLGLLAQFFGFANLSPLVSIALGVVVGVPLTWLAARWVRRLMDEAGD